jgi:hypothetical protein
LDTTNQFERGVLQALLCKGWYMVKIHSIARTWLGPTCHFITHVLKMFHKVKPTYILILIVTFLNSISKWSCLLAITYCKVMWNMKKIMAKLFLFL